MPDEVVTPDKPKHYVQALKDRIAELEASQSMTVSAPASVSAWMSEESFIDKCVAEMEIDFSKGQMTDAIKKFYNALDAKVKLRRVAIEIVAQVGIGNEWPQWVSLGRNSSTGVKEAAKVKPVPEVVNEAPPVTEGGMPIRERAPGREQILAKFGNIKAGVQSSLDERVAARV